MRIGIIGTGSLGTALATHFYRLGHHVVWWGRDPELVEHINRSHRNPRHLKEFILPDSLKATYDMSELTDTEILISAVPTPYLRNIWSKLKRHIPKPTMVNTSKGIELDTGLFAHQIFSQVFEDGTFIAMSGPSFAREIMEGHPTAVVLAGEKELVIELIHSWTSPTLRFYASADITGTELAGAYKNVLAIAAGAVVGMGMGRNSWAALITRGIAELVRLGIPLGADLRTFMGLAGVGDIVLTCSSSESRNFTLGRLVAEGVPINRAIGKLKGYPEGYLTSKAMLEMAKSLGVETPIVQAVVDVLFENHSPEDVLKRLTARPPKEEFWGLPDIRGYFRGSQ